MAHFFLVIARNEAIRVVAGAGKKVFFGGGKAMEKHWLKAAEAKRFRLLLRKSTKGDSQIPLKKIKKYRLTHLDNTIFCQF
jgi:hypothetical protein